MLLAEATSAVRAAIAQASAGLIERESLVELIALAAVAREHLLVIGPPGTAKSEAVRRVSRALEGRYFEYLLGRFTEPNEIFGPVDLKLLREGVVQTRTAGMLPEAEIAFLDEVFLGSTAILNTLLAVLNERRFRRGQDDIACPLRVCVGASNGVPTDPALAAFADRFLLRVYVDTVGDPLLEDLLEGGWNMDRSAHPVASVAHLDCLADAARAADMAPVRPLLAQAIRRLRHEGIHLSDRRVVKVQRLVAAAAVLAGRSVPTAGDLWPIVYAVPDPDKQAMARDALRDVLAASDNAALPCAAEHASVGPLARATRILATGRALIDGRPDGDGVEWRLRIEGVVREIDAGFAPGAAPDGVDALRIELVGLMGD